MAIERDRIQLEREEMIARQQALAVQEQIPADEAARTQDIIQTAVRIVDQHREGTRYLRDAHAKAHGCVKAEVQVLKDLSPELRQVLPLPPAVMT